MENKKHETTIQLEEQCVKIANEINTGNYNFDSAWSDYDEPCADDYLAEMLDYRTTISREKEYLGSHILVTILHEFGGPNILINTLDKCIEGHWGSDSIKRYYCDDNLGIDDYMEEMYNCS